MLLTAAKIIGLVALAAWLFVVIVAVYALLRGSK